MSETKTKLITRPELASELMRAGYVGDPTINPYEPKLTAWNFELDPKGFQLVADFYSRLKGKGGEPS